MPIGFAALARVSAVVVVVVVVGGDAADADPRCKVPPAP